MEPNGGYTSEDYISYVSPLHEALRGTTAMPTLEQFLKFNSSLLISTPFIDSMSIILEPEEDAMFPSTEHSTFSYNMDAALPPPILPSSSIVVASTDRASPFLANFMVSAFEIRIFSMQATSTIQGNPLATMDASLNSSGVFNLSSVPQYPECQLYGEKKPNTILRPSPYEEFYDIGPSVNTTNIYPFLESKQVQLETQQMMMDAPYVNFHKNFAPSTRSIVSEPRRREYTCKHCEMTFPTSQAYGGHMSSHNKAKNKMLLG
ncbi:unnamed protein product [Alopecurus aequalis]